MSFTKFVNFTSAFVSAVFNEAHGAMWAINGRLSGFYPDAQGGDTLPTFTPGIMSITLPSPLVGTRRVITVNLIPPGTADDFRFSPTGQITSFCLANGVLLKSDATAVLSLVLIDPPSVTLDDSDEIVIFAEYDDSGSAPTFGALRRSAIDNPSLVPPAGTPSKKAKLVFYDSVGQVWQPEPQISVGGIFQTSVDIASKYGGLLATRLDSGTLKVTAGTIIGSFGRISSTGIRLVPSLTFPTPGLFRKDLLVIVDPESTTNELTQPAFVILQGTRTASDVTSTEPPPAFLDPRQVPLAEIMMSSSGIGQVIDIRPIMAWQTDSMMQSAPVALAKIDINTVQPGVIMTDTTQNVEVGWGLAVFRGLIPVTGINPGTVLTTGVKSSIAIGLVGIERQATIMGPVGIPPLQFVPGSALLSPQPAFPAKPWILEDTFHVFRNSDQRDVTHDPAYAVNFDFKNGIFAYPGITAQSSGENFTVKFRQLETVFVIDDDGTVHVPDLDAFYRHVQASNPIAHTADNITFNNVPVPIPGQSQRLIPVQTALEELSRGLQVPSSVAVYLEPWRMFKRDIQIFKLAGALSYAFNFIGPSGYSTPYVTEPLSPVETDDDGIICLEGGLISAVTLSFFATSVPVLGTSWTYSIWVGGSKAAEFTIPSVVAQAARVTIQSSAFNPPGAVSIQSGQVLRLGLTTPSHIIPVVDTAISLTLALDFVIQPG